MQDLDLYVNHYKQNAIKQFQFYQLLAERTFSQIDEKTFFWQYNPESNSIAITAKHMAGNMISRWTDFLTTDGEKKWRNREGEFEVGSESRDDIMKLWQKGWQTLYNAIEEIDEGNFSQEVLIRNIPHSITEAVNRQIAHLAYHTGQIAYIGRMAKGSSWKSLSIPKGKSEEFNKKSFAQENRKEHFTDEWRNGKS